MKGYQEHPETREFTGSVDLPPDPLTPGQYIFDRLTHAEEPPVARDGFAVVRDRANARWVLVRDNRGVWYDADQEVVQITSLDADVSLLTRTAPPSRFHDLRGGSWVLNSVRAKAELKLEVNRLIDAESLSLISEYPATEVLGFAKKADEAAAGSGPMLQAEINAYYAGRTPPADALRQLARRVQGKEAELSRVSGYAAGVRRALHERIDALDDRTLAGFDARTEFASRWNPPERGDG